MGREGGYKQNDYDSTTMEGGGGLREKITLILLRIGGCTKQNDYDLTTMG